MGKGVKKYILRLVIIMHRDFLFGHPPPMGMGVNKSKTIGI